MTGEEPEITHQGLCTGCGQPFIVRFPCRAKTRKYCSHRCFTESLTGKSHSHGLRGSANPSWKGMMKPCIVCGGKVQRPPTKFKGGKIFCSVACRQEFHFPALTCTNCSVVFRRPRWQIRHVVTIFCSPTCVQEFRQLHPDLTPNYTGGRKRVEGYGTGWRQIRLAKLNRNPKCERCGRRRNLVVHHVIPQRAFLNFLGASEAGNLLTLCRPCHRITHQGLETMLWTLVINRSAL